MLLNDSIANEIHFNECCINMKQDLFVIPVQQV